MGLQVIADDGSRDKASADAGLFGVRDAPVNEGWVFVLREFLAARVVVLASVGEYNAALWRRCRTVVGVTSVEKCSHWMLLEEIQVPVPWLGVLAPHKGG